VTMEDSWKWFSAFMVMFLIGIGGLLLIACVANVADKEPYFAGLSAFGVMFYIFIAGYLTRAIHTEGKK